MEFIVSFGLLIGFQAYVSLLQFVFGYGWRGERGDDFWNAYWFVTKASWFVVGLLCTGYVAGDYAELILRGI